MVLFTVVFASECECVCLFVNMIILEPFEKSLDEFKNSWILMRCGMQVAI